MRVSPGCRCLLVYYLVLLKWLSRCPARNRLHSDERRLDAGAEQGARNTQIVCASWRSKGLSLAEATDGRAWLRSRCPRIVLSCLSLTPRQERSPLSVGQGITNNRQGKGQPGSTTTATSYDARHNAISCAPFAYRLEAAVKSPATPTEPSKPSKMKDHRCSLGGEGTEDPRSVLLPLGAVGKVAIALLARLARVNPPGLVSSAHQLMPSSRLSHLALRPAAAP